jgi:5'-3' exonuclease
MSKGDTLNARDNTLALVRRCMEGIGFAAPVALCCDRGRSFRRDLFDPYKGNRPEKDLQAIDELRRTERALADEGFCMWGADTFEADDVIATAARIAADRGHPVRVATGDKDLLQLLDIPGVEVQRTCYADFPIWTHVEVAMRFGVDPATLGDWLGLTGDTSDNIRGCPGVGEKTATKLLAEYGSLEAVLEAAARGDVKNSVGRALAQNAADIRRDRQLVALRFDTPIDFEEIYRPRERKRPANVSPQEDLSMPNEMSQPNELGDTTTPAASAPPAAATHTSRPIASPPAPEAAPVPAAPAPEPPARPAETKALAAPAVIVPEVFANFEKALEPANAAQALNMASVLWSSGLYTKFPNKEALYAVMTRGRELGLPAGASLDVFHWMPDVQKIAPLAHLVAALVERDPSCEYLMCVETDDKKATYEFKHRRHPRARTHTYSIEDAVQAGMCQLEPRPRDWTPDPRTGKPPKDTRGIWDARRPEQLRKTCVVQIGRIYFPAAALGLYAMEEFGMGDQD